MSSFGYVIRICLYVCFCLICIVVEMNRGKVFNEYVLPYFQMETLSRKGTKDVD
jgi:hypothetical protein